MGRTGHMAWVLSSSATGAAIPGPSTAPDTAPVPSCQAGLRPDLEDIDGEPPFQR